jgi:two-component system NtrC family sensor kinase
MGKYRVLIVDDDELTIKQLKNELQRNFYEAVEAFSSQAALHILEKQEIALVLLDVKLPDMDGLELLRIIKERWPQCEVIIVTGFGTQNIAIQSLRRGAIDYIEKPIKLDELDAAMGRAMEKIVERDKRIGKNTLLVIDNNMATVTLLKNFLAGQGYDVLFAYDGITALELIENNKIDLLITDIKMPDLDGIEVIRRAKVIYKDIEGIVVTAYQEQELAVKALRAGAIDYLLKPLNTDELLMSVKKAIECINLRRKQLYRNRELKISSEIISKVNEELERRIQEKAKDLCRIQTQLFQTSKLATLGEMAAGLAHEMNQPLGGISLVVKHFRKLIELNKLSREELEAGFNDIEASIKRMSKTIQHIRTFARQDTLSLVKVDVNSTIDSALSLLGEQLRLHEITVKKNFSKELPRIIGEPYQLEQVWINLLTNARDALDEREKTVNSFKKNIVIITHHNQRQALVEVDFCDNGIGMDSKTAEKVFDPFFTTKEVGKATGLGLSISYGIIESHKGKISLETKENQGTTVKVLLPAGVE